MQQGFTVKQASRLTNCTLHQLRYWDQVGLVPPSVQATGGRAGRRRMYSFADLVSLRVVRSLLDSGMSLQRVRRAWEYLRRHGDIERRLSEVSLVSDGYTIYQRGDDDQLLDALRNGQLAFLVEVVKVTRQVEDDVTRFELDRERFLEFLRSGEEDVRVQRRRRAAGG